ncbi:3'-5' exonuclease [Metarhizium acridum]|uniref:RNA exonuclease 4 n=1 Tax=Metarhizium acridum (strain CQMa 102) TaxID=655827 RepID=E9EE81_METAQ|nr:RNA exonuclease 4 [Metarhizium acridum CQMa 102]EFY85794.1 RNA exonuclease 4 [Metarhizium acridum CQMa 102]KAG8417876.1 3'-5' exonuclease [Metarhizium acridum]
MAELSSNWKKLQAKLNPGKQTRRPSLKRKAEDETSSTSKIPKFSAKVSRKTTQSLNTKVKRIPKMGAVHSSRVRDESNIGQSPSIGLWATDRDVSSEALAEAYGLGIKESSVTMASHSDKVNHGRSCNVDVGKYVGLDCEMVGVGQGGHESALARISLVDFHGRQIYDSYVKPKERVTDWRTAVSGVSQREMRFAREFEEVQREVYNIIEGRILVGHDINHDLDALKLSHPPRDIRDTAKHHAFKKYGHGRKPSLRVLARELLAIEIQEGPHSSTEDARVTMLIFRKYKSSFDTDHANRYQHRTPPVTARKSKKHRRKH